MIFLCSVTFKSTGLSCTLHGSFVHVWFYSIMHWSYGKYWCPELCWSSQRYCISECNVKSPQSFIATPTSSGNLYRLRSGQARCRGQKTYKALIFLKAWDLATHTTRCFPEGGHRTTWSICWEDIYRTPWSISHTFKLKSSPLKTKKKTASSSHSSNGTNVFSWDNDHCTSVDSRRLLWVHFIKKIYLGVPGWPSQ